MGAILINSTLYVDVANAVNSSRKIGCVAFFALAILILTL